MKAIENVEQIVNLSTLSKMEFALPELFERIQYFKPNKRNSPMANSEKPNALMSRKLDFRRIFCVVLTFCGSSRSSDVFNPQAFSLKRM